MFFSLLQKTNLKDYIGNMEIFAGLMASLVHDMNHSNYSAFFFADRECDHDKGASTMLGTRKKRATSLSYTPKRPLWRTDISLLSSPS